MVNPTDVPAFISQSVRDHRYVFFNLRPSPRERLAVTCAGWERCAPDYQVRRPSFPYCGLEYVARGSGRLTIDATEHRLHAGSVFGYAPDTPHEIVTDPHDSLEKYFVDFTGTQASDRLRALFPRAGRVYQLDPPHWVRALFDQLLEHGERVGATPTQIPVLQLDLMMALVEENAVPQTLSPTPARATYERCCRYLEQHFLSIKSIQDFAAAVHLDPSYLSRLFQREGRQSPTERLVQLKMNAAARRLTHSGLSIKEVAEQIGYDDPFHFSRVFKKYWGVAPTVFAGRMGR